MKIVLKYHVFLIVCILLTGCSKHIKPEKFDVDHQSMRSFKSSEPIQVVVPDNAEKRYLVDFIGRFMTPPNVYVDLNDLYRNARELIGEVLAKNNVPLSPDAKKYLKFTITKAQWENRPWGNMVEAYLEFDIETGDSYKKQYRVQDGSFWEVGRAVGGTTSRAVERIFQDEKIISYIESH